MRNQPREGGRREREEGEGRGRGRSEEEVVKAGAASPGHKKMFEKQSAESQFMFCEKKNVC